MTTKLRPKGELENILWAVGRTDISADIELARELGKLSGLTDDRLTELLGPVKDVDISKLLNIVKKPDGFVKNALMYVNKKRFESRSIIRLLNLTGHGLLVKWEDSK